MAREKQTRRMIAMALAAAVTMSSVPVVAFAEESQTVTGDGTMASPQVTVTMESNTTTDADGNTVTTDVTTTVTEGSDDSTGESINSTEVKTETTVTDTDGAVDTTTTTEGESTTVTENTENVPDVTVQLVPGETTSNTSDVAEPVVTGPDTDKTDGEWDYTTTTETPREVTATMGEIETFKGNGKDVVVSENIETNLDAVNPEWVEDKEGVRAPITKFESLEAYQEALNNKPDGYDFLYTGYGEDSLYGASWGFWNGSTGGYATPVQQFQMTDLSDPSVLEGENWQQNLDIHTGYCVDVETGSKSGYWYDIKNLEDAGYYGTKEAEDHIRAIVLNGYWGTDATVYETNEDGSIKIDTETGKPIPKTDDKGSVVVDESKTGSLAAMQAMLKDAQKQLNAAQVENPDAENPLKDVNIDGLTEGEALAATQMAIWKYGNPYEPYTTEDGRKYEINFEANTLDMRIDRGHWTDWVSSGTGNDAYIYDSETNELGMTDEQIEVSLARINAVYEYLIGLSMTAEESGTTEIITEEKVAKVDSLNLTVGDKADGYAENSDNNDDNDVYNVSLNFALVVEPDPEKDDMIVKVVRIEKDDQGNIISTNDVAKARLAGDDTNDEGFSSVVYDKETGSYTLSGLELAENANCEFNLKLEGAQYLEQGVYIYSSEIRNDVPSQTFVGIAEGYKSVDVGMKVDLAFNVEEGTITERRSWRNTSSSHKDPTNPGGNDPDPTPDPKDPTPDPKDPVDPPEEDIPEEDVPLAGVDPEEELADIGEDEVPMANAPEEPLVAGEEEIIAETGDSNHMTTGFGGMFAALAGMFMLRKKREN